MDNELLELVKLFDERFGHLFYDEEDVWEYEDRLYRKKRREEIANGAEPTFMEVLYGEYMKRMYETPILAHLVTKETDEH